MVLVVSSALLYHCPLVTDLDSAVMKYTSNKERAAENAATVAQIESGNGEKGEKDFEEKVAAPSLRY